MVDRGLCPADVSWRSSGFRDLWERRQLARAAGSRGPSHAAEHRHDSRASDTLYTWKAKYGGLEVSKAKSAAKKRSPIFRPYLMSARGRACRVIAADRTSVCHRTGTRTRSRLTVQPCRAGAGARTSCMSNSSRDAGSGWGEGRPRADRSHRPAACLGGARSTSTRMSAWRCSVDNVWSKCSWAGSPEGLQ